MSLKFPNARLFIHDLLSKAGLTEAQAIVKTALEYGLIQSDATCDMMPTRDECPCMAAARRVLFKHFEEKNKLPGRPYVDSEEVWSSIEKAAEIYRCGELRTGMGSHDCLKFAPALFDVMLQQISRYP